MKKRFFSTILVGALCAFSLMALAGCSKSGVEYDYDLSEYIKIGEYKGLEYKEEAVSVTDKEVQDEIEKTRQRNATVQEVTEGVVEDGDTINVSYKGKIDGKEFKGGSTDSSDLVIGQSKMIDGFIEGLKGQKIGSKVTLNLRFPDDYQEKDLAGKDVVFDVNIKCKKVKKVPEYDLDFVKANSKFDSKKDYEKSVKDSLLASKQEQADEAMKQGLWEQIVKASKVMKYPKKELKALIKSTKKSVKENISKQGMKWEDYLKQSGTTEEDFDKTLEKYAKDRIQQDMVVHSIARKEKLKISNDEYEDFMKDLLKNAGFTEKSFKDNFGMSIEKYCEEKGLRTSMLLNKVINKVIEYGKAV